MNLPSLVLFLLNRLTQAGFTAYAVGGCVRDSLMGREPHDWDICTSATPERMKEVFADQRMVETGLQHGTLTVLVDHVPYEITTYRLDGDYADHRRPDSVTFVDRVEEDLSRRDFTVNAMACGQDGEIIDPFGGREDLGSHLIRCVGEARKRLEEDALRILRALRFASVFDFSLEEETSHEIHGQASSLQWVSAERKREELLKLLCGPGAGRILREYPDVLAVMIPEIAEMVGLSQNNHHHTYDLWEHTVRAVENIPPRPDLRLTMLLHDTGKLFTRVTDENGESHFRGHPDVSAEIAARVTKDLRLDNETRDRVILLARYHDITLRDDAGRPNTNRAFLLRRLNKFGEQNLRDLFHVHRADRIATGYSSVEREDRRLREREQALDALLVDQACFRLKDLAVNGYDMMALGLKGPDIGRVLNQLLADVVDGKAENNRDALLARVPVPGDGKVAGTDL